LSEENELIAGTPAHGHEIGHVERDDEGSKLGMWLFLFTEVLLFGGLFVLYSGYRFAYSADFVTAAAEMNTFIGAINTIILLTSSLSVALSIAALRKNNKRLATTLIWFTIVCGFVFLVNKYFEWTHEIGNGIYPRGPALDSMPPGEVMYFGLYYCMTGLHGLHVIIGMTFLGFVLNFIYRDKITSTNFQKLENAGLYWHLVDLIWIFLFPLFYLIH